MENIVSNEFYVITTVKGKAKARVANIGNKHSDETKAKISAIHKGKKQSPEFVAKRVEARRINKLNRLLLSEI